MPQNQLRQLRPHAQLSLLSGCVKTQLTFAWRAGHSPPLRLPRPEASPCRGQPRDSGYGSGGVLLRLPNSAGKGVPQCFMAALKDLLLGPRIRLCQWWLLASGQQALKVHVGGSGKLCPKLLLQRWRAPLGTLRRWWPPGQVTQKLLPDAPYRAAPRPHEGPFRLYSPGVSGPIHHSGVVSILVQGSARGGGQALPVSSLVSVLP